MWERFSTSGLAGAYVDELLAAGVEARMEFRPRRAFDPYPFLVCPGDADMAFRWPDRLPKGGDDTQPEP
ncbi:hypothetical protein BSY16_1568 [Sinorhizobium sp. RAC02]|nr:hypothetical protein BSY16_1568 [Sinorhizobium sp. RAC02]